MLIVVAVSLEVVDVGEAGTFVVAYEDGSYDGLDPELVAQLLEAGELRWAHKAAQRKRSAWHVANLPCPRREEDL